MTCFENRCTFNPGNVQEVSEEKFERWLEQATPDALEAFGRARFPRWFSTEAPMPPMPRLWARGQSPRKPQPSGGRLVGGYQPRQQQGIPIPPPRHP